MSRPLRFQFSGGVYHVTSRGNDRRIVFRDDHDRRRFLELLEHVSTRFDWEIFAYCLMNNHYHLFLETPEASLARGMRDLNGPYAQSFNRRYGTVGHVFQARYHSVLVQKPAHILSALRYIVLNPVAAGLCERPEDWLWSSHRAMLGQAEPIRGLAVGRTLRMLEAHPERAVEAYQAFVSGTAEPEPPPDVLDNPGVKGSEEFARAALTRVPPPSVEVTRRGRRGRSMYQFVCEASNRNEAMRAAYRSGTYSLKEIAAHFGLHASTASKICKESARNDNSG